MKYILIILLTIITLTSCEINNIENKPILNEITDYETKYLIKKDSLYENIIRLSDNIRDTLSKDKIFKNKFSNITYKDILDYDKEFIRLTDSDINKSIELNKPYINNQIKFLINNIETFKTIINNYTDPYEIYFIDTTKLQIIPNKELLYKSLLIKKYNVKFRTNYVLDKDTTEILNELYTQNINKEKIITQMKKFNYKVFLLKNINK